MTERLHFQFSLSLSGTIESTINMCSEMIVVLLYKKDPATSCTFILLPLKMYIFIIMDTLRFSFFKKYFKIDEMEKIHLKEHI